MILQNEFDNRAEFFCKNSTLVDPEGHTLESPQMLSSDLQTKDCHPETWQMVQEQLVDSQYIQAIWFPEE